MLISFSHSLDHVSAGYGCVDKQRKSPGSRGMAGSQHHHRANIDKFHPGYFGKVGMHYYHKKLCETHKPSFKSSGARKLLYPRGYFLGRYRPN